MANRLTGIRSEKFQTAIKALLLLALALFLYSRLAGGTLFFYINQRFVVYTMLAIIGLLLVAISYRSVGRKKTQTSKDGDETVIDLFPQDGHSAEYHDHHDHEHTGGAGGHDHRLTLAGVMLFLLPIILGVVVPPQPLGAAALSNREVNVGLQNSALPSSVRAAAAKQSSERNILDWLNTFAASANPSEEFAGQDARVTGFVFRDDRFGENQFMVTRFVVSCCVADANVAGLVVNSPDAAALAADQWVEVSGRFEAGALSGETLPVLQAQLIKPVDIPEQPYLYP